VRADVNRALALDETQGETQSARVSPCRLAAGAVGVSGLRGTREPQYPESIRMTKPKTAPGNDPVTMDKTLAARADYGSNKPKIGVVFPACARICASTST